MTKPRPYEPMSTKIWRWSGVFAALAILLGFATALTSNARVGNCLVVAVLACLAFATAGLIANDQEGRR
jgi:4-hydroxybenzoate polyprenyltransferase